MKKMILMMTLLVSMIAVSCSKKEDVKPYVGPPIEVSGTIIQTDSVSNTKIVVWVKWPSVTYGNIKYHSEIVKYYLSDAPCPGCEFSPYYAVGSFIEVKFSGDYLAWNLVGKYYSDPVLIGTAN
jgi:hypothetical protein